MTERLPQGLTESKGFARSLVEKFLYPGEHAKLWGGLRWRDEMEGAVDCRNRFLATN